MFDASAVPASQESIVSARARHDYPFDSVLRVYLLPEFGGMPIGRITHEVVQRYVNRLAADPNLSAVLVRGIYAHPATEPREQPHPSTRVRMMMMTKTL